MHVYASIWTIINEKEALILKERKHTYIWRVWSEKREEENDVIVL